MTVFAFWFDRNKELNYPFLGTRVLRGSRFFNDFTTRVNSYIGTTIVVPDKCKSYMHVHEGKNALQDETRIEAKNLGQETRIFRQRSWASWPRLTPPRPQDLGQESAPEIPRSWSLLAKIAGPRSQDYDARSWPRCFRWVCVCVCVCVCALCLCARARACMYLCISVCLSTCMYVYIDFKLSSWEIKPSRVVDNI